MYSIVWLKNKENREHRPNPRHDQAALWPEISDATMPTNQSTRAMKWKNADQSQHENDEMEKRRPITAREWWNGKTPTNHSTRMMKWKNADQSQHKIDRMEKRRPITARDWWNGKNADQSKHENDEMEKRRPIVFSCNTFQLSNFSCNTVKEEKVLPIRDNGCF